jgi:hypothetical protein
VATKYDFDAEGNGGFRLFPTAASAGYARGAEVFNSYGRRDNSHLLLHYGFAILDNEHERVALRLPRSSLSTLPHAELAAREGVGYRCSCKLRLNAISPCKFELNLIMIVRDMLIYLFII